MQKYEIIISNQFYDGLEDIFNWIKQDNLFHANKFRDGIKKIVRGLAVFPESGKNLPFNTKAKVYKGRFIIYTINHQTKMVNVIDLIDPQQHTRASKYI